MSKALLTLFILFLSNLSYSLTVIVTEYGNFKVIKKESERIIEVKTLGGVYHLDKKYFFNKSGDDWIKLSKNKKILKSHITPLSDFKMASAKKYLNGCYIYYEADSETHIRLNESGEVLVKRASISGGKVAREEFTGELKIHSNVVALVDDKGEVILSSEVSKRDNKLLVFNEPIFNEWEVQYVIKDCTTGDWIYPKKPS